MKGKENKLMSKTFLIGDTHFSHANIIKYCSRPYENTTHMNTELIRNWNLVVGAEDKVIVVGDFALTSKEQIIAIGNSLNGHKRLILGNHDKASLLTYYAAGFETISPYPIVLDEFFIVSHYPQFIERNGVFANIFAHVHDNPEYVGVSPRSFCVSVERINYTPIDFEDIKARMMEVANGD